MRRVLRALGALLLVGILLVVGALAYVRITGLRAASEPGPLETRVARLVRAAAIPKSDRERTNPVPASAEAVAGGMAHFADHCAVCHANDGSGDSQFGRGLFPKPPDMRTAVTQDLTDGELFYIVENGVRFTGMPAFSTGPDGAEETWRLVHFIRHLPRISPDELERMEDLNPRSPSEVREEIAEEEFLKGGSQGKPPASGGHRHDQGGRER